MICAGLFLANVGDAVLIKGLKPSWSTQITGAGLAIIFLRSGLELDIRVCASRLELRSRKHLFCAIVFRSIRHSQQLQSEPHISEATAFFHQGGRMHFLPFCVVAVGPDK